MRALSLLGFVAVAVMMVLMVLFTADQTRRCEARGGVYFPRDGVCLPVRGF